MSSNPFDEEVGMGAGIDLSSFDDDFAAAEAPEFKEVPDGRYQAKLCKAQLTKSSTGSPMIKWDLLVLTGEHAGQHIFKNSVISDRSLPYVKGDLKLVGVNIKRLSELPGHIGEALDKVLELTLRTKGEYTNCYFNKVIDIPQGAGEMPENPW